MALTDDDVREILRLIDESELDELRIETDEFKLHVVRGGRPRPRRRRRPSRGARRRPRRGRRRARRSWRRCPASSTAPRSREAPFVEVGAQVEPDTIVCIIEVMKMMNSVPAGVSGTIVEIRAENAQAVEYGETLFRVGP